LYVCLTLRFFRVIDSKRFKKKSRTIFRLYHHHFPLYIYIYIESVRASLYNVSVLAEIKRKFIIGKFRMRGISAEHVIRTRRNKFIRFKSTEWIYPKYVNWRCNNNTRRARRLSRRATRALARPLNRHYHIAVAGERKANRTFRVLRNFIFLFRTVQPRRARNVNETTSSDVNPTRSNTVSNRKHSPRTNIRYAHDRPRTRSCVIS